MFKGYGKVEIRKGVRVKVDFDFCRYYKKLIDYYHFKTLRNQLPAYGAHISVVLPKIHNKVVDFRPIKRYNGRRVEFTYNPEDVYRSAKNIWMRVDCPIGNEIKERLGIKDKDFLGFHLTLVNFKFNEK